MAISATISLSPSTVTIGQPVTANVTVSNSGASAVNVTSVTPIGRITSGSYTVPCGMISGEAPLGPGMTIAVNASSTLVIPFQVVFPSPSGGPIGVAATGTYDVSCVVLTSDGSVTSPTAATVTVNSLALPTSEQ